MKIPRLNSITRVTLIYLAAALLPLKLSLAYIVIIPLIAWWIFQSKGKPAALFGDAAPFAPTLLFFFLCIGISSLFGLHQLRSLQNLPSFMFFTALFLVTCDAAKDKGYRGLLLFLVSAQSLAAFHSYLERIFPDSMPHLFLGKVTESGQIALVFPAALGLLLYLKQEAHERGLPANFSERGIVIGLILFALLGLTAFFYPSLPPVIFWLIFSLILLCLIGGTSLCVRNILSNKSGAGATLNSFMVSVSIPLMAIALLINLKRGPWAGVLVGTLVFFLGTRKRMFLPILATVVGLAVFIEPVRTRLEQSPEHFFISGGRSVIWEIGVELATTYPLGIGYGNSPFLREFSPQIPMQLRHFHNNFLNILVESGWISLGIYLWWIMELLIAAFLGKAGASERFLARGIGCSIISWQVAGMVEYNIGDSEVFLIAMLLVGVLARLAADAHGSEKLTTEAPEIKFELAGNKSPTK